MKVTLQFKLLNLPWPTGVANGLLKKCVSWNIFVKLHKSHSLNVLVENNQVGCNFSDKERFHQKIGSPVIFFTKYGTYNLQFQTRKEGKEGRKETFPMEGFLFCTPSPPTKFQLSFILCSSKTLTFKTFLPLGISDSLPWGRYGFFFWNCTMYHSLPLPMH